MGDAGAGVEDDDGGGVRDRGLALGLGPQDGAKRAMLPLWRGGANLVPFGLDRLPNSPGHTHVLREVEVEAGSVKRIGASVLGPRGLSLRRR